VLKPEDDEQIKRIKLKLIERVVLGGEKGQRRATNSIEKHVSVSVV